jgi:hypothetical protein
MPPRSPLLDPETMSDQELTDLPAIPDAPVDPLVPADGDWTRKAMQKYLAAQPKRAIAVPRDHNDKPGQSAYLVVFYQGFRYPILKGRSVEVPEPIALIAEQNEDGLLRTAQAKNIAHFLNDVTSPDGAEIPL